MGAFSVVLSGERSETLRDALSVLVMGAARKAGFLGLSFLGLSFSRAALSSAPSEVTVYPLGTVTPWITTSGYSYSFQTVSIPSRSLLRMSFLTCSAGYFDLHLSLLSIENFGHNWRCLPLTPTVGVEVLDKMQE